MSTITIRVDDALKQEAKHVSNTLGIPLTLVLKTALKNFVKNPTLVIGDPQTIETTPTIEKKLSTISTLLNAA